MDPDVDAEARGIWDMGAKPSMGKQSRRPKRRSRAGRVKVAQGVDGLKISIFTSPELVAGEVSLNNELRLVRSALLYADTVELVSPAASMLNTFSPLSAAGELNVSALLSQMADETLSRLGLADNTDQVRQVFEALPQILALPEYLRRRILPADQEAQLISLLAEAQEAMTTVGGMANGLLVRAGAPELEAALADGALVVDSAGFSFELPTPDQVEWFSSRLRKALNDSSATLLLDDRTIRHLQDLDIDPTSAATTNRASKASVGSGLIERLPTFPDATMNDVLEVRGALAPGRSRYRGAVKRLTSSLASSAFDDTLSSELSEMWHDEVRPALREMQETVKTSHLGRGTMHRLASDYKSLITGGTLFVAIENLAHLSPSVAGTAALGANAVWQATAEVLQARAEVRKHDLVYLLDVHKGLGGKAI